ncbi:PREDICTED: uncharacterized protein LOC104804826 [Tarenaya hassleriana]|uniref:uncharacterized protein LOC104804826 n=1 Tax=Tarenaya hassleriana TaxID=28532 RepID=UPI00053C457F|nr:PREDICTED: uncharacterized protein LOC104804826 [Tarenaya hassleriana]
MASSLASPSVTASVSTSEDLQVPFVYAFKDIQHRALRLEGEEKEFWFVVNGVPIRYSIQEHAIISDLNFNNYSEDWTKCKGSEFRKRIFVTSKVTIEAALKKLRETPHANVEERNRLAIIVLF